MGVKATPKIARAGPAPRLALAGAVVSVLVALLLAYNGLTGLSAPLRSGTAPARQGAANAPARAADAPARAASPTSAKPLDAIALQAAIRKQASAQAGADAEKGRAAAEAVAPACADSTETCGAWAEAGECEANPAFMNAHCALSCRQCTTSSASGPGTWLLPPLRGVHWERLAAADAALPTPSAAELGAHCPVGGLLSPQPIKGLHVVCRLPTPGAAPASPLGGARLAVWRDADASAGRGGPSHVFSLPEHGGLSMAELLSAVGAALDFEWRGAQWQPPAWFTPDGARLQSVAAVGRLLSAGPLCLFEGGQFIWPPGELGSARKVALPDGHLATIRTLSLSPIVLSVEDFLRPHETEHIIGRAAPHLAKSGVALKDADAGKGAAEFRTSSQYFLPTDGDSALEAIDARVQGLLRVPISHAEYIQVLRYERMEHYSAHHDYFDPREYASNVAMRRETKEGAKNRLATVFFYLSDVQEGGATNFPRAGGGPTPRDFFDCSKGLSVYPRNGKVIVFYSMHPSSQLDPYSLHGGCDVLNGTKFSANFWLWNEPYHYATPQRMRAFAAFKADMWLDE